jgi:hypothetical protein
MQDQDSSPDGGFQFECFRCGGEALAAIDEVGFSFCEHCADVIEHQQPGPLERALADVVETIDRHRAEIPAALVGFSAEWRDALLAQRDLFERMARLERIGVE